MKTVINPQKADWKSLCKRPTMAKEKLAEAVTEILQDVKQNGDKALFAYAQKFNNVALSRLEVTSEEIEKALAQVPQELKNAIQIAHANIQKFHAAQVREETKIETTKGVVCWRKSVAIEKVGLYIPGGSAPLFSTVLMLAVPAKIAGSKDIILCSPPNEKGELHPAIIYAAQLSGVTKMFKVGGAQAIAALSYGTETIPQTDKIFGPGNQYVTEAKMQVQKDGTAIDMPAGPSEVLVIADETSEPKFVAADLLSQAEHGSDSQVILLATNSTIVTETNAEIEKQLADLPRKKNAESALKNSLAIVFDHTETALDFSNEYAPEHLILATANAEILAEKVQNAGSVFIGKYACESAGDYASGTNHTLPTNGYARQFSGVSLDSFLKKITFQKISAEGILNLGETIEIMADAEGLNAHRNAVSVRLNEIKNGKN